MHYETINNNVSNYILFATLLLISSIQIILSFIFSSDEKNKLDQLEKYIINLANDLEHNNEDIKNLKEKIKELNGKVDQSSVYLKNIDNQVDKIIRENT
jgi:peptidoglycan hydrolase CwlO-like protein